MLLWKYIKSTYRDKDKLFPDLEIRGLKAKLSDDSSIIVSWKPVREISGDVLIQILENGEELKVERECYGNSFKYKPRNPSTSYQFKVSIEYEDFDARPFLSNIVYSRPDRLKNLEAVICGGTINVTWDKPNWKFRKYKIEVFMGKRSILQKRLHRNEFCVLSCKLSKSYRILVKAKDTNGVYSKPIEKVVEYHISPIEGLCAVEENGKIHLRWNKPEENNMKYEVKLSTQKHFRRVYLETRQVSNVNEVSFNIPKAREGKKYYFEMKVKNLYNIEGKTIRISHTFSGLVTITMHILLKASENITVFYGSDEKILQSVVEKWKEEGYKSVYPTPMSVVLHSTKKYKNNIHCKENTLQIHPAEGHEMQQQCLLGAQPVPLNFCIEPPHHGKYTLEFKLGEVGLSKTMRTDPFNVYTEPEHSPSTRNHIETVGVAIVGGNGSLDLSGKSSINVNTRQVENRLPGHVSAHVVPEALSDISSVASNNANLTNAAFSMEDNHSYPATKL